MTTGGGGGGTRIIEAGSTPSLIPTGRGSKLGDGSLSLMFDPHFSFVATLRRGLGRGGLAGRRYQREILLFASSCAYLFLDGVGGRAGGGTGIVLAGSTPFLRGTGFGTDGSLLISRPCQSCGPVLRLIQLASEGAAVALE